MQIPNSPVYSVITSTPQQTLPAKKRLILASFEHPALTELVFRAIVPPSKSKTRSSRAANTNTSNVTERALVGESLPPESEYLMANLSKGFHRDFYLHPNT